MFTEWCNLCQSAPAEGELTGYFSNLPDELLIVMACKKCVEKAFEEPDFEGIR